jgi:hypothetical protein
MVLYILIFKFLDSRRVASVPRILSALNHRAANDKKKAVSMYTCIHQIKLVSPFFWQCIIFHWIVKRIKDFWPSLYTLTWDLLFSRPCTRLCQCYGLWRHVVIKPPIRSHIPTHKTTTSIF